MASKRDQSGRKQNPNAEDNPFTPISLTPAQLRNNPAREVTSSEVRSRDIPMVSIGDHSAPATRITENRFDFSPLNEARPDLRVEQSLNVALRLIDISPIQMHELRERRVAARELGWSISGHRIRIGP